MTDVQQAQVTPPLIVTVYMWPNGFMREATDMYGWLRHHQFTPRWVENKMEPGGHAIAIPPNEISQLQMLKKANPARWGTPLAK